MKIFPPIIFLSILLLTNTLILKAQEQKKSNKYSDSILGIPNGLTVESIRDPKFTFIVDSLPEFSWVVPQEASFQNAYQILVSSSKFLIDKNIGDIWNSGKIISSSSSNIELSGRPLKQNSNYFWKIRLYDKDDCPTEYSEPQYFKTGSFGNKITSSNYFKLENISPSKFIKNTDESYFIDFGKAAFGTLQLNYNSLKDDTLIIRLGEKLKDGIIDQNPGGTIRFQEVKLNIFPSQKKYNIELKADKRNTNSFAVAIPDSFPVIMPFRYAEIYGANNLKSEDISQIAYFDYYDSNSSAFTSSDETLNQVWDLCKYSIKATTFSGYYVDGDRERIPYEADAYLNQLSHYSIDNEYAIARKTIEYFMEYPTWPTEWQLHVALMFYQDYMYTGNTELIKKYYEPLKHKTLMALVNEEGFISTYSPNHNGKLMQELGFPDTTKRLKDIVDWPPAQKDTDWKLATEEGERDGFDFKPINTVVNSFYYQNMKIMAEFAEIMNKPEDELDFKLRADKVKDAINNKLFNKVGGYYTDGIGTNHGSIHANMLPLTFNIVPDKYKKSVAEYIKKRGMACSVYGAQYLLEALYNSGYSNYALELMTSKEDRSWFNMLNVGSTITMEAWDMKYKPNADWNHAWGAAPANIIPRYLWGIQPKTPGYETVTIKPQMGDLETSSITLPTIKGKIMCSYNKINIELARYSIELPANMRGEFIIDSFSQNLLSLNGESADPLMEIVLLNPGINILEIVNN